MVGLDDRRRCETYAGELLKRGFISQALRRNAFTPHTYYTINDAKLAASTMRRGVLAPLDANAPAPFDATADALGRKRSKAGALARLFCLPRPKKHRTAAS